MVSRWRTVGDDDGDGTNAGITHCRYRPLSATAMVEAGALDGADIVVVDPPRKGLDPEVLQALLLERRCDGTRDARSHRAGKGGGDILGGPSLLVYVSCGFDAFERDCAQLTTASWKLDHAEGHILFPGSDAIETLAFFTR